MKILTLCYEFPPLGGGGSRVVYGLTRELIKSGCEVDLVTMAFANLPKYENAGGVGVHRVPCIRTKVSVSHTIELMTYVLSAIPRALELARKKSYDLNHTHFIFPDGLIAYILKKKLGLPYIITAHGSDVPGYNPDRFKAEHRLLFPLWKKIVKNAESVVCPSQGLKSLVLRSFSDAKTSIIPNGIEKSHYSENSAKTKSILIVSRIFERKGVQYFLKSLENLNLNCEINIVGDGPYLATLKKMANQMNARVRFTGWFDNDSPELRRLYETTQIFVLPSEMENCPMVLLEAMAHGMAIITTEGTGCAEVVADTGLLVPPKNPDALRNALLRLTGDSHLCAELGRLARQRFEERYQWSTLAGEYRRLYESCSAGLQSKIRI